MKTVLAAMLAAMVVGCGGFDCRWPIGRDNEDDEDEDEDCTVEVVDGIVVDERTCEPPILVNDDCRNDDDCTDGTVCYFSSAACMDDDVSTVCDDVGRCGDPDTAFYCATDEDCGGSTCLTDDRFCLKDRRDNPLPGCAGWCVRACFGGGENTGVDPDTGICWVARDCNSPPGFLPARPGQVCRPL